MRDGAVGAALGRLPATRHTPELNVSDLGHPLHDELRLKDRIVQRDVLNGELLQWQHLAELVRPLLPGKRSPEVVHPEEPAFEQIESQPLRLFIRQTNRSN